MTTQPRRPMRSTIPADHKPADGRFGCGPSKVRPEQLAHARRRGRGPDGHLAPPGAGQATSSAACAPASRELFALPDGYEVVLGNGGTTAFWDAAAVGLVRERALHLTFGEFSPEVRHGHEGRAVPRRTRSSSPPSPATRPSRPATPSADAVAWAHNETSTGVDGAGAAARRRRRAGPHRRHVGRRRPAGRRRAGRRLLLRAAEVLRRRRRAVAGAAEPGGASSAIERAGRVGALDPRVAVAGHRAGQLAQGPDLQHARGGDAASCSPTSSTGCSTSGGLDWLRRSARRANSSATSTTGREDSAVRDAVRRRPGQALARRRHHRLRRRRSTPPPSPRRCAPTASSTPSPTASSAATSCASGMFPAIDPADVQALTACIDWVVDRMAAVMRVLVAEKIGASGRRAAARALRRRTRATRPRPASTSTTASSSARPRSSPPTSSSARRNLKAIGRAGVGVDNVDVAAATKRGIVVANAPQSNVVTAAEHTMALLLALARNVPAGARQPHRGQAGSARSSRASSCSTRRSASSASGASASSSPSARRASACASIAFDPFVGAERYRELGVEQGRVLRRGLRRGRLPHRAPAQDAGDRGLARRRGAREVQGRRAHPQRRPRAADRRRGPRGGARLRQGRRRGARRLPLRADHRAPAVRLPQRHRHAAPRRLDRRGDRPRRLPGRRAGRRRAHRRRASRAPSTSPPSPPRTSRCSGPFLPLCAPARAARRWRSAEGSSVDRVEVELLGRIAERDTRPLGDRGRCSACSRATPRRRSTRSTRRRSPRSAGSSSTETRAHAGARLLRPRARDRRRPASSASASSARRSGSRHRPHLLEAWGQRFNLQLERPHRAVPLPRRARDDRARRHVLRRERHQHRLGRRRPRARATATRTARR